MCYNEPFYQVSLGGISHKFFLQEQKKVKLMAFNRSEELEKVACYAYKALLETTSEVDSRYFPIIFCSL